MSEMRTKQYKRFQRLVGLKTLERRESWESLHLGCSPSRIEHLNADLKGEILENGDGLALLETPLHSSASL
jgi:hypothetical protein